MSCVTRRALCILIHRPLAQSRDLPARTEGATTCEPKGRIRSEAALGRVEHMRLWMLSMTWECFTLVCTLATLSGEGVMDGIRRTAKSCSSLSRFASLAVRPCTSVSSSCRKWGYVSNARVVLVEKATRSRDCSFESVELSLTGPTRSLMQPTTI